MAIGQHHILGALFSMGYLLGSPNVSTMLPPPMERAFTNLHREFNDFGLKAYGSTAATVSQIGEFIAPAARAATIT